MRCVLANTERCWIDHRCAMTKSRGNQMKRYDILACAFVIVVGFVWFAAAEIVYDGSLMEDPFLRSGMFAQYYVPIATMYLIKVISGERRGSRVVAWLSSFLVFWVMIAIDVGVTHYKPNCDYCCIPANECLMMESVFAIVMTASASVSDGLVMCWLRNVVHPIALQWFCRRAIRVIGTVLLTWLLFVLIYWVLYAISSMIRLFVE